MSYRNSEGYYDPTAGAALAQVKREEHRKVYRPLVYICSRYSGDTECNTAAARNYCKYAVDHGCIPVASHLLYPQFLNDSDPAQRKLGLLFGKILMDKCDEVWVFGTEMSAGMIAECKRARRKGYRIRLFTTECREITGGR